MAENRALQVLLVGLVHQQPQLKNTKPMIKAHDLIFTLLQRMNTTVVPAQFQRGHNWYQKDRSSLAINKYYVSVEAEIAIHR